MGMKSSWPSLGVRLRSALGRRRRPVEQAPIHTAYWSAAADRDDAPGRRIVDESRFGLGLGVANRPEVVGVSGWPQRLWRVSQMEGIRQSPQDLSPPWKSATRFSAQALTLLDEVPISLAFGPNGEAVVAVLNEIGGLTSEQVARASQVDRYPVKDQLGLSHPLWMAALDAYVLASSAVMARAEAIDRQAIGEVARFIDFPPEPRLVDADWECAWRAAQAAAHALVHAHELSDDELAERLAPWRYITGK